MCCFVCVLFCVYVLFLGAYAKMPKATINFVMSVRLFVLTRPSICPCILDVVMQGIRAVDCINPYRTNVENRVSS